MTTTKEHPICPSPIRVQRKRTKGYKMPTNTVSVTRPGKWGNPFTLKDAYHEAAKDLSGMNLKYKDPINESARDWIGYASAIALQSYKRYMDDNPELVELAKKELKGKNLACFCAVGEPCHADILLKLANW